MLEVNIWQLILVVFAISFFACVFSSALTYFVAAEIIEWQLSKHALEELTRREEIINTDKKPRKTKIEETK